MENLSTRQQPDKRVKHSRRPAIGLLHNVCCLKEMHFKITMFSGNSNNYSAPYGHCPPEES